MTINACFRGGAADGLGYARVLKEFYNKDILFNNLSGTSAGSLMAGLLANGHNWMRCETFFKDFPGDKTMMHAGQLQAQGFSFGNIFKGISVFFGAKRLTPQIEHHLENWMSWDRVRFSRKVNKLYICFAPEELMAMANGLKKVRGVRDALAWFKPDAVEKLKHLAIPMYASDDGVYAFIKECNERHLTKISNDVIPLHLAVFGSFWNPVFRKLTFKFELFGHVKKYFPEHLRNETKWNPFDGGIMDNHAILPHLGTDYHVFICDVKSPDLTGGRLPVSDDYYWFAKPQRVHLSPPLESREFFEFLPEAIEAEFSVEPSDFIK